jgi:hypothetical protein
VSVRWSTGSCSAATARGLLRSHENVNPGPCGRAQARRTWSRCCRTVGPRVTRSMCCSTNSTSPAQGVAAESGAAGPSRAGRADRLRASAAEVEDRPRIGEAGRRPRGEKEGRLLGSRHLKCPSGLGGPYAYAHSKGPLDDQVRGCFPWLWTAKVLPSQSRGNG